MGESYLKRTVLLIFIIIIVSVFFFAMGSATSSHNEEQREKEKMVLGHSLYQLYMATLDIIELKHSTNEEQKIFKINESLKRLNFASTTIDTLTDAEILYPITRELTEIHETIYTNYNNSGVISESDKGRYERLFDEIQILHEEFHTVYYEPDSEAVPRDRITNFGELVTQKERLLNKDWTE